MESNQAMREFFDRQASFWHDHPEEEAVREGLAEILAVPEGAVIGDLGCGRGVFLPHLLSRNPAAVYAVDLSGEMLRVARQLHSDPRVAFLCCDLLTAELPPLDAAILFNAYSHFLDKPALAAKMAACVRPGGVFMVAHSRGKEIINGGHRGAENGGSPLSVPLKEIREEAAHFAPFFTLDAQEDSEARYFFRLIRGDLPCP